MTTSYTSINFNILNLHDLLFLFLISICISCTESDEYINIKDPIDFSDSSFSSEQKLYHSIHNNSFVGNPVRLTRIDTLLFAIDSKTDTITHVFSTNIKKLICDIIPRGIGPNELLSVGFIREGRKSNSLCAYDVTRKLWQEGNINPTNLKYQSNDSFHFSAKTFDSYIIEDPIWFTDHSFVCTSLTNYKERYFIFNDNAELIKTGSNPNMAFNENTPNGILSEMSSALLGMRPNKTQLVLAGRFLNYIEIYNLTDNKLEHHLRGPKKTRVSFDENKSISLNTMIKTEHTSKSFLDLKCSNNHIYILYSGKERKDPSGYTNSNIIYSFKWDGTPHILYKLDTDISAFDIDEEHSKIYAIKYPDNSIISFNLLDLNKHD